MAPIGHSRASGKLIRRKSHVRLPCKRKVQHAGDFNWLCKACTCYVNLKKTEQDLIIYGTEVEFNSILTPLIIKWTSTLNISTVVNHFKSGHGLIIYKDTKTKCRLYWGLKEFIDWSYSRHVGRPNFVNYFPSNPFFCSPPPPPSQSQSTEMYIHCVAGRGWGGGGLLSYVGDHILQEFNTLYLTRYRTYKIALPPQTINLVWEGASDI